MDNDPDIQARNVAERFCPPGTPIDHIGGGELYGHHWSVVCLSEFTRSVYRDGLPYSIVEFSPGQRTER